MKLHWKQIVPGQEPFHFAHYHIRRSRSRQAHSHADFFEIFWVEKGAGKHLASGKWRPLKQGDLVLVKPGQQHCLQSTDAQGLSMLSVAFHSSVMEHLSRFYFQKNPDFYGNPHGLPLHRNLDQDQCAWFLDQGALLAKAARNRLEIDRFLMDLFQRLEFSKSQSAPLKGPEWLQKAFQGIQEQRHFSRGTAGFTALAGRSPEHVAREAKRHLDMTPTDIVNRARLEFAARQLEGSNQAILKISLACGFENLGHFYKLFKKQFNTTPRQYRLRRFAFHH